MDLKLEVGPIDLLHGEAARRRDAGQFGGVRSGALDSDGDDGPALCDVLGDFSVSGPCGERFSITLMFAYFMVNVILLTLAIRGHAFTTWADKTVLRLLLGQAPIRSCLLGKRVGCKPGKGGRIKLRTALRSDSQGGSHAVPWPLTIITVKVNEAAGR